MSFLNPTFILSILIALSVHEWAHAFSAHRLGDPTAEEQGRLTLNPISHIDPLGAILFLMVGFGWGKPVPINPMYFKRPKRDTAIVSLAGPLSNLILAMVASIILAFLTAAMPESALGLLSGNTQENVSFAFFTSLLTSLIFINLALMAFNLLPVAPLDGSKVLQAFIPWRQEEAYERLMRWGPYILLGLLLLESFLGVRILSSWILGIMNAVLGLFRLVLGAVGLA